MTDAVEELHARTRLPRVVLVVLVLTLAGSKSVLLRAVAHD